MTNSAYAKSNGDGLLCSILCYQIKSFRMNMGGWVVGWGKGIEALNLLQLGKAYNGRMNTQTEALIKA